MRNILGFVYLSVGQFVPWSVALQNLIVPITFQLGPDFFIFINSVNAVLFLRKYFKNLLNFIIGNLIGAVLSFLAYLPYIMSYSQLNLSNGSKSWGLSSYWKITLHAISGDSLNFKINSKSDIDSLLTMYPNYLNLHRINYFLLTFLLILSLIYFRKNFTFKSFDII